MSESSHRPALNGSGGLDPGTVSAALPAWSITLGRIGEPLDLDQFDDDDNVVAALFVDQYDATLAETRFGVPVGDVLPAPRPFSGRPDSQLPGET